MTNKRKIPFLFSATLYEQFACRCVARRQAKADQNDLPARAPAQAGAAGKRKA